LRNLQRLLELLNLQDQLGDRADVNDRELRTRGAVRPQRTERDQQHSGHL